jgi:hypothetical protein
MSDPPGQVSTRIESRGPGAPDRTVISSAREVEQGARSMLLLLEGRFRLDVIPQDDTIQTILRGLAPEARFELRFAPVGGASYALGDSPRVAPSTGRFGGEVVELGRSGEERVVAKILVGSVCHLQRGVTGFTAQATVL